MQTLKKSTAALIVSLLSLFLLSVFAFSAPQTIIWDDFGEDLTYAGELTLGENTYSELGAFAFGFTADKEGLYAINFSLDDAGDECAYSMLLSGEIISGQPTGYKDSLSAEEYGSVYYFQKEEKQFYGLTVDGDIRSYSVNIQYLGDIESFSLSTDRFQADFDICLCDYDNATFCEIYAPVSVSTSTGEEFTVDYLSFPWDGEDLASGSYDVRAALMGREETMRISVYHASDYVTDITPADGYTAPVVYFTEDGEYDYYDYDEGTFAVDYVLTDGTVIANDAENYDYSFTADDGTVVRFRSDVLPGEDGGYYWTVYAADDFSVILSEAQPGETDPVIPDDDPEDTKEGFLKTIFQKIRLFFQKILSFFKSLLPGKAAI